MEIESNGRYDLITNGVRKVPINVNINGSSEIFIKYVKMGTYQVSDFIDLYSLEIKTYTGSIAEAGFYCCFKDDGTIFFINVPANGQVSCNKYILVGAWDVTGTSQTIELYDPEKRLICFEEFMVNTENDSNAYDTLFLIDSTTLIKCNVFN